MRRFAQNVKLFSVSDIMFIGNLDTGCLIGLTSEGAKLCRLFSRGRLSEDSFLEKDPVLHSALKRNSFFEGSGKRAGKSSYLHITQRCNLACVGCYSKPAEPSPDLSLESLVRIVRFLSSIDITTLHISGGEPFLREDLLDIATEAKNQGFHWIDIITNGTCVRPESAKGLSRIVDMVYVSLGNFDNRAPRSIKGHNCFDRVIDNINLLQSEGVKVSLLPTIHSENIDDMPRYAKLARELGAQISFSILSCSSCNPNLGGFAFDQSTLRQLAKAITESVGRSKRQPILTAKNYCGAGIGQISVAADGKIYPCHMLHSSLYRIGDALEGVLLDSDELTSECRNLMSFSSDRNTTCRDCRYKFLCGGGCRARAASQRSPSAIDPYCVTLRHYYAYAISTLLDLKK